MKLQFCNLERNKICLRQNTKNETLPIFDSVKDLIKMGQIKKMKALYYIN